CGEGVIEDGRSAARKRAGAPGFPVAGVSTLAIGIGATTAIFSTVNATLLRPLPFAHPEELVALRTAYSDGRVTTGLVAAAEVARLNTSNLSIAHAVGLSSGAFDVPLLRDKAAPVPAAAYAVSDGFFELFGLPMTLGSAFTRDQQAPVAQGPGQGQGPPPVIVLSHRAWTEWFGSDSQIVGK